jgi:hypothetical protein
MLYPTELRAQLNFVHDAPWMKASASVSWTVTNCVTHALRAMRSILSLARDWSSGTKGVIRPSTSVCYVAKRAQLAGDALT